jgi:hypothetical protein
VSSDMPAKRFGQLLKTEGVPTREMFLRELDNHLC